MTETDAFTDVLSDTEDTTGGDAQESSTDDSGNGDSSTRVTDDSQTVTDVHVATDSVRSELPDEEELRDDKRYKDPDSDNEADDVDPRGLFAKPTLNELRYYAREGPYGQTIVQKPIKDIFKHGFEVDGDYTEKADEDGKAKQFLEQEYKEYYIEAERKSRRDGLAVLMHQIADSANSIAEPIDTDSASFKGFQIWTLDNLTDDLAASTVAEHTKYTRNQIYVSEGPEHGGVAIVDDINHEDYGEVVGYGVEPRSDSDEIENVQFVHGDRCQAFVWNEWVDGNLGNNVTGKHVGESVITNVLQPLKATQMGYWAMKNILFRYSAPLHAVEPPESWGPDEFETFTDKLDDISMASDATLPPGAELSVAEGVSEFDPEPIYEVLVESICAGTVFTKSVLQGTQTGTVSGSETDIKGYFNEIDLLRTERTATKFRDVLKTVSEYDQETVPPLTSPKKVQFDFGPLFKPTDIEQAEGAVSLVTAATNAIKNYVLTPEEARSLIEEEWAEFDIDIDLGELTEQDRDNLDRINIREAGQGPQDDEPDVRENPRQQNGGGQPEGQTRSSSQPTRTDSLSDEELDELADRLADRL